jgi:tetratricopeptide (TPR) repeat protein
MLRYGTPAMRSAPAWRTWAERADRYAPPGTVARVHADLALAGVEYAAGRLAPSRALTRKAMDLAQALRDHESIYHAAWILLLDPVSEAEALGVATTVAALPRTGASPRTLAGFLILAWSAFLRNGDRPRAEAIWSEVEQLGNKTRDPNASLQPLLIAVVREMFAGDPEAAVAAKQAAIERGDELGIRAYGQTLASVFAFRAALYLGQPPEFEELDSGVSPREALQALAAAHDGRYDEAVARIRELLAAEAANVEPGSASRIAYLGLEIANLAGDRELAAALVDNVAGQASSCGAPAFDFTCIARHLGNAHELLGRWAEAREYFEKALQVCERIAFQPGLALSHFDLAELLLDHYPNERDLALKHLDIAIEALRQMKMQPALERALGRRGLLKA